ncbi:collagen alpha-1(XV) chain-like [Littorina saxatilis]|uniref:collagen alpha-1(XV) chain-like n=1 Tax=Littorina saxatilis TaxID=31220 RepID=UPI0038B4A08B
MTCMTLQPCKASLILFQTTTEPPPVPLIPPPNYTSGPALQLVALNTPVTGRMRGVRGADYLCHRQARSAGMNGTYRAFLSNGAQNLESIIYYSRDRQIPITNKAGQMLFNSWEDLVNGAGGHFNNDVPLFSFDGKDVMNDSTWPQKFVWHGSSKKGGKMDGHLCKQWYSRNGESLGMASSLNKHMLLDQDDFACNNSFVVLCIQREA